MIGSTYSVFTSSEIDETANVYKTGVLDVVYTVSEDNVQLTNVEPMSIEDGDTVYPYRITVTNNGTVPYQFDVLLNNTTAGESISNQYIMTKVGYLDAKLLSDCTDNIIKEDVVVLPGTSVDVDVRVWIDSSITNSEIGKSFYAKLSIDGLAVYSDEKEIDNSDLSLIYMDGFSSISDTSYFHNSTYVNKIKNVSFVNYINTNSSEIVQQWDMSDGKSGTVIAWLENNETTDYYDLYIGAKQEIYAKDLKNFFYKMQYVDNISFDNFNTALAKNMSYMFYYTGCNSTVFTLDLGDKFDTRNVTNMSYMFSSTGNSSTVFTLDLGEKFDTENVTNMSFMFSSTGKNSTEFTLDLGENFNTSNVSDMSSMFYDAGYSSTEFTLDLGEKFDTRNVTNMSSMFRDVGYNSTEFTLDLGENFDTSNVDDMSYMFYDVGRNNTGFTLNLGEKFNTSSVGNMSSMFYYTGRNSTVFTLDLGDKFYTSKVTDMSNMFRGTGYESTVFTLDLGEEFNTSNVTNMSYMFYLTGYRNNNFVLDLSAGSYNQFNFNSVTAYTSMIYLNKNAMIWVWTDELANWIENKSGFQYGTLAVTY